MPKHKKFVTLMDQSIIRASSLFRHWSFEIRHFLGQISVQPRAQFRSRAKENAFDRGHGEIEDFGDFLVAELFIAPQNQGHALALWELRDRVLDCTLELGLQK